MNKELEAFELIKCNCNQNYPDFEKQAKIVENALKRLEKPYVLMTNTRGKSKSIIDYICKNWKEVKITNLEDQDKLKALEIIKEKKVNVNCIISGWSLGKYNSYKSHIKLTQKEYDLLKEVLL